ncbi:MAG: hypothetical protein C0498_01690 [Anaerolinea sp.]|nr:hypothetical protein [Anaerolinea sp.]
MIGFVYFEDPADLEAWLAYRPVPAAVALCALSADVDVPAAATPTTTTEPRPRSLLDRIKTLVGRLRA